MAFIVDFALMLPSSLLASCSGTVAFEPEVTVLLAFLNQNSVLLLAMSVLVPVCTRSDHTVLLIRQRRFNFRPGSA